MSKRVSCTTFKYVLQLQFTLVYETKSQVHITHSDDQAPSNVHL